MSAIKHPCFVNTERMGALTLAAFTVPKRPVSGAAAAFDRAARALVAKFNADLEQIEGLQDHRDFGGGVSRPYVHHICARPAAERFTDEEIAAMRAAVLEAFPGATLADEWHNQSNGWPGYSIRFREPS